MDNRIPPSADGAFAKTGGVDPCDAVTLSLLWEFDLRCGGVPIDASPSSRRLISYLALHTRPSPRNLVSSALWPDATDRRANANLRSSIWRAPRCGGEEIVHASNSHVWLSPGVRVDITQLMGRARDVIDQRVDDADLVSVARELSTGRAELLVGWYDDWLIAERECFRQLRLHALDQLGERLLQVARYADAVQVGLASVVAEPLREAGHRLLVRTHLREGNVAQAIRQYQGYARLLDQELGASPSAAMVELLDELISVGRPRTATQA